MAGESPDRSKQRESSAEPTSGSPGPVPEARTEQSETAGAAGKPDPRLAMTRETDVSAVRAESGGGVDTATRVLSVREAEDGTAEDGTEGEAAGDGAETAGSSESPEPSDSPEPSEPSAPSESPVSSEAGESPEAAEESDGRLRDAVAAWVRSADDAAGDAEDAGGAGANAEAESEAEAASDAEAEADRGEDARETAQESPEAEEAAEGAEVPSEAAQGAQEPAEETVEESAEESAEESGVAPAAGGGTGTARGDEGTEGAETGADGDSGGDSGGDGDRPVDQATAVFKAVRPSAPAVDQPTTMLKLGDGAARDPKKTDKTDKADGPERTGTGAAEAPAERTSKFVALKPLDDPSTRKPPPAAEATTALPRVTRSPKAPQSPATAPEPPKAAPRPPKAPPAEATAAVPQVGPERTTQQPLPPKPPLDLLAELTNTPPPPETPLRTAVRRVKIWTPLVLLLVVVFAVVQAMRPLPEPTLDLTAQESFTFEGGMPEIPWPASGQAALDVQGIGTFGSSGEQKPVPIASVAKVMTAYVILREHKLGSGEEGPKIAIDQAAEDQSQAGQESTVNVYAGDSISQREALESILIASANNVARLLARWDAGSEKAFVEKMNATAEELGMTNTTYTDPSGLDNTTVSTAVDQVKLAKAAMKEPAFREVAAMMSYDDYKGVNHSNWNHLVGHNGVVGIKTGTTTSALGNLVFAAKKEVGGETRTIIGAVVRQPAGGKDNTILGAALDSSDKLIRAAQDALESATILKKGDVVGYVDDGLGGRTPVVATQDVKAVGWPGLTVKLTFAADDVPHTAEAGTKVGTLTVGDGGTSGAVKVPVALQKDLVEPALADKLTRIG
ncbi:serine hydrolase [Streptomyces sp. HMX87]|uniref:serine hydrolase n=1 Tax=Streptomyces sp. HMX87 TaxID=3390849 RepID=UPI003A8A503C